MIPIEFVAVLLVITFGIVGLIRHFPRELGATLGYVAMLFMLSLAGERFGNTLYSMIWESRPDAPDLAVVKWSIYMAFIAGWVVIIYAGRTITFSGSWPPSAVAGFLLDGAIGLFNGWLVVWTAWHYTHVLDYPLRLFGLFVPPLTPRAQAWVGLAPLAMIPNGYDNWILGGGLALLIFLLVVR